MQDEPSGTRIRAILSQSKSANRAIHYRVTIWKYLRTNSHDDVGNAWSLCITHLTGSGLAFFCRLGEFKQGCNLQLLDSFVMCDQTEADHGTKGCLLS